MKSVPEWIFYLHEFSWNFSQHLAISFELFSFRNVFNSGIICHWVPPLSLALSAPGLLISTPSPHGALKASIPTGTVRTPLSPCR
jgi:hypothetical protein